MRKHILFSPSLCFVGALLIATPVVAQAPTPPQEFWDYLTEYGDDDGDLLDPLEYDQILSMKESEDANAKDAPIASEPDALDKPKVRNADMKFEKKSSAQASSSAVKGATL